MSSVKMRQLVEREIAEQVIKDALAAGYVVGVFDSEDETVKGTDFATLAAALMTTDEDTLTIYPNGDTTPLDHNIWRGETTRIGWVKLVYGNDGWDVINDYTTNLEHIMWGANKLIAKYGD